jgi:ABC-type glycerol-3-phosphate transport system substrate-binding protein
MGFQKLLVSVFGVIAVVAVIYFAIGDHSSEKENPFGIEGEASVWGTFSEVEMAPVAKGFSDLSDGAVKFSYSEKDPESFDQDLVESLASGNNPDIVMLPDYLILRHSDKIEYNPYSPQFGPAQYEKQFAQASWIFLDDSGVVAFPFALDPLVMYWNRDLFTNASLTSPPKTWEELRQITPRLTKKDNSGEIQQSSVAFGEFSNVTNAKDVIALLFLQSGKSIVRIEGGVARVDLLDVGAGQGGAESLSSPGSALRYFMTFSNPRGDLYSWNRAMKDSEVKFADGSLAIHFAFASEYSKIKERNPHLNFGVAMVPQPANAKSEITLARTYGLVSLKRAKDKTLARAVVSGLLRDDFPNLVAKQIGLPPVQNGLLALPPVDAAESIFYESAIRSRSWLDPSPARSKEILQRAVEDISAGVLGEDAATARIATELALLLQR